MTNIFKMFKYLCKEIQAYETLLKHYVNGGVRLHLHFVICVAAVYVQVDDGVTVLHP